MTTVTPIAIESLRRDGGTQPRDHISMEIAKDYAEAMADGVVLPPVTVFFDGTSYWLADGFHRALAHELLNAATLDADVRQGTQRDAVLYSVGANASHGYRRSNADKRRAVVTLLEDPEWAQWSDREIARRCAVGPSLVNTIREKVSLPVTGSDDDTRVFRDRHGNPSVMRVAAIGRARPPLPAIGGHIPDRRPDPLAGQSPEIMKSEAALVTGFDADRLIRMARAGEVPGAEKDGNAWVFKTEKLRDWISAPPEAVTEEIATGPANDFEEGRRLLEIIDAISLFATIGPASAALQIWAGFRGNPIPQETIDAASAWMADFSARYSEVERTRQLAVADMLERIEANVVE